MNNFFIKQPLKLVDDLQLNKDSIRSKKIIVKSSEERELCFKLSDLQFENIIKSDCFYCGEKPREYSEKTKRNGIDRFDNNKGYEHGNVVACCWTCNKMKGSMEAIDFINHVNKVYKDTNELHELIKKYGSNSFEVKARNYSRGRYPSPNEAIEFIIAKLLTKFDMKDYDFKKSLKMYPNEYNIVKSQLRNMGIKVKNFSITKYYKTQIDQWEGL